MHDISKYNINFVYDDTLYTVSLYQAQQGDKAQFSLGDRTYTFEGDAASPQAVTRFFESIVGTSLASESELVTKLAGLGAHSVSLTKRTYDLVTERLLGKQVVDSAEAKEQKNRVRQALLGSSNKEEVATILQSSKSSVMTLFDIADEIENEAPGIAKMVRTLTRPFDLEKTVQNICSRVEENYFDEALGKKYADALADRLDSYKGIYEVDAFTAKVTQDLREISRDGHFELLTRQMLAPQGSSQDTTFGFRAVKSFDDGTCSLEMLSCANPHNPEALEKANRAMQQLREARPQAIVLDLRKNHGGSPYMSAYIASHFLPPDIPLTSFRYRHEPKSEEREIFPLEPTKTLSLKDLPAEKRLLDVPLYILTSHETFSAAEDLACHLKEQGRATIIGQTSGGGSNPAKLFDAENDFCVAVPIGEITVPYGKNWDGRGIDPHIHVPGHIDPQSARQIGERVAAIESSLIPSDTVRPGAPQKIAERMQTLGVPGASIAVINNGDIEWAKGYGELNDLALLSQAASISKMITAVTILTLVEKNLIALDTDVSTILGPDLWKQIDPEGKANEQKVTIRRLLSHTAGTTVSGFAGYQREQETPLTTDDILLGKGNSKKVEVAHVPGGQFEYSGGGTTILQKVVEVINAPKSFSETVQELVFAPLEMKHSSYLPADEQTVQGTKPDSSRVPGGANIYPEHAAAGLWSTALDLAKVAVAIQKALSGQEGGLFSQNLAKEMLTAQTKGEPNGLGLFVDTLAHSTLFSHAGGNQGFRCILAANTQGQGVAVMTNSDNGQLIWKEVLQATAKVYEWPDLERLPMCSPLFDQAAATKVDSVAWLQKFAGTYTFESDAVELFSLDGKIFAKFNAESKFEVVPFNETVASFRRTIPGPFEKLEFSIDANNQTILDIFGGKHIRKDEA